MPASKSLGYFQNAALSSAKSLTDIATTIPTGSDYAIVQAQDQPCRYRYDTTAPTASVGTLLAVGDSVVVTNGQMAGFKIIETTATAKVNVEFFKTD